MAKARSKATPVEVGSAQQFGSAVERLSKPEQVGTINVAEAAEIRTRNALIKSLEDDYIRYQRLLAVVKHEKILFIRNILANRGLDNRNEHSVDDETGVVTLLARYVEQTVEEVEPPLDGEELS